MPQSDTENDGREIITTRVSPELRKEVKLEAARRDSSMSQLIRDALANELDLK